MGAGYKMLYRLMGNTTTTSFSIYHLHVVLCLRAPGGIVGLMGICLVGSRGLVYGTAFFNQ